MIEPVINLRFYDPLVITSEEYEAIRNEVLASAVVDEKTPALRVLARLILDNEWRYNEVIQIRAARQRAAEGHPDE